MSSLEGHAFLLEGGERGVVEGFDAVLDAADALVQRFVLLGLAGEERVFLAQALQLFALSGKSLIRDGVRRAWKSLRVSGRALPYSPARQNRLTAIKRTSLAILGR